MKRITALLLALVLTALTMAACGEDNRKETEAPTEAVTETKTSAVGATMKAKAKQIIEESFDNHTYQGAAYMMYKGEEVYAGGVGKADKKADIDNGPDVVYQIASITKQFTAAAILKLCEAGKMALDDTLSKYFPDYTAGGSITIHNLLSMQSGIPDYVRDYDENGNEVEMEMFSQPVIDGVEKENSLKENRAAIEDWIFSQDLLFEQGERFSYSNSNYFLLGEIIEQVSGQSYFDYLKESFFEPLGMDTAGFLENYDIDGAQVAHGYYDGGGSSEIFSYSGVAFGCGDMMASPKDMYKWTVALHSGKVLSDEMYQKMITEHCKGDEGYSSYGYGLMIKNESIMTVYFHTGSIPCFMSCVMYVPQKELYLALMSNHASEGITGVAADVSPEILTLLNTNPIGL